MRTALFSIMLGLTVGFVTGCSQPSSPENPAATTSSTAEKAKESKPATAAEKPAETAAKPAPTGKEASAMSTNEVAVIKTAAGDMVIEFWPDVATNTVENFKKLAKKGFYDGTAFHRIVKGFMIQGGDPLTRDPKAEASWGTGGPGYSIKAEFSERSHCRGTISMARSQDPDSAGSQFFICLGDAKFLDRQYTAFGQLIRGDDVLGKLGDVSTVASRGEKSRPVERQGVESVRIVPADSMQ